MVKGTTRTYTLTQTNWLFYLAFRLMDPKEKGLLRLEYDKNAAQTFRGEMLPFLVNDTLDENELLQKTQVTIQKLTTAKFNDSKMNHVWGHLIKDSFYYGQILDLTDDNVHSSWVALKKDLAKNTKTINKDEIQKSFLKFIRYLAENKQEKAAMAIHNFLFIAKWIASTEHAGVNKPPSDSLEYVYVGNLIATSLFNGLMLNDLFPDSEYQAFAEFIKNAASILIEGPLFAQHFETTDYKSKASLPTLISKLSFVISSSKGQDASGKMPVQRTVSAGFTKPQSPLTWSPASMVLNKSLSSLATSASTTTDTNTLVTTTTTTTTTTDSSIHDNASLGKVGRTSSNKF